MSTVPPGSQALQSLVEDHLVLRRGLAVLESIRQETRTGRRLQTASLLALIDFFRGFGDGCHHAKEDKILFPEMKDAGLFRPDGPLATMMDEHHHLRDLMAPVEAVIPSVGSSRDSANRFFEAAGVYADGLSKHLVFEESTVFHAASLNLGAERLAHVSAACAKHDLSPEHANHRRYVASLEKIAQQHL